VLFVVGKCAASRPVHTHDGIAGTECGRARSEGARSNDRKCLHCVCDDRRLYSTILARNRGTSMAATRVVGSVCTWVVMPSFIGRPARLFSTLASVVDVTNLSTRRHHSHFRIHSSLSEFVRVKTKE
jgi:hypothetical protein